MAHSMNLENFVEYSIYVIQKRHNSYGDPSFPPDPKGPFWGKA